MTKEEDLEFQKWLDESFADMFDEDPGFQLLPSPAPTQKKKTCGYHQKNKTPIALPEKSFEKWFVCRNCGKPMSQTPDKS